MRLTLITMLFMTGIILQPSVHASKIDELEGRVEELEFKDYSRYFTLGGSLKNHFESYTADQDMNNSNSSKNKEEINAIGTILQLNINFDVSKNLKIYTRLGMSKFWGSSSGGHSGYNRAERDGTWDTSQQGSMGYQGSTPKFDRAYMSYSFDFAPLTFSIGRLATNNGPPEHKGNNEPRTGTYPRFIFNSIFDGASLAYDFTSLLPSNHLFKARFFASPFVNIGEHNRTKQRRMTDIGNTGETGIKIPSLVPMYVGQLEYSIKELPFARNLDIMFFRYQYDRFYEIIPGEPDPDLTDDYIAIYEADVNLYYLGLDNVFDSGFSINGSLFTMKQTDKYRDAPTVTEYNSTAYLLNATYLMNNKLISDLTFGLEFVHTDSFFYIDDFTDHHIARFYATPGNKGFHYSLHKKLDENIGLKIGYMKMDVDLNNYYETEEEEITSFYTTLTAKF